MADKIEKKTELEREYTIPLRREWAKVPRYKRTNKAIKAIKEFLVKHMKIRDRDLKKIKLDKYLNEQIWFRGIKKPPARIKVKAIKEGEIIKVELSEMHDKLKFKKAREEKRETKAKEILEGKKAQKPEEKPKETKTDKETEEKRETEKEKKSSVVEEGKMLEKAAAKNIKHETKQSKQPKRQQRKALAK